MKLKFSTILNFCKFSELNGYFWIFYDESFRDIKNTSMCLVAEHLVFDFTPNDIYIKKVYENYRDNSNVMFFKQQFALWKDQFSPMFAEILLPYARGFSFNLLDAKKLLKLNK